MDLYPTILSKKEKKKKSKKKPITTSTPIVSTSKKSKTKKNTKKKSSTDLKVKSTPDQKIIKSKSAKSKKSKKSRSKKSIQSTQKILIENPIELQSKKIIRRCYMKLSGYGIPRIEREFIELVHSSAETYGELQYTGVRSLIKHSNIGESDVFYDLGSGIGKVVLQIAIDTPCQKINGIELSATRMASANQALERFKLYEKKKN